MQRSRFPVVGAVVGVAMCAALVAFFVSGGSHEPQPSEAASDDPRAIETASATPGDASAPADSDQIAYDPASARMAAMTRSVMADTETCVDQREELALRRGDRSRNHIAQEAASGCAEELHHAHLIPDDQIDDAVRAIADRQVDIVAAPGQ